MTPGLTGPQRPRTSEALRRCYAGAALLLAVAVVVPPLYGLARRYEFAEAVQFSVYAMAVPALLVLGAPFAGGHLAKGGRLSAWIDRLASGRRLHRSAARSALFLGGFMVAAVAWRTPGAVAALERDPWLVAVEGASLVVAGAGFWLELVESGRLVPRARRPFRGVMAAVGMWTVWTISYLGGFSSTSWYTGFHHFAGGLERGSRPAVLDSGLLARGCARVHAGGVLEPARVAAQRGGRRTGPWHTGPRGAPLPDGRQRRQFVADGGDTANAGMSGS